MRQFFVAVIVILIAPLLLHAQAPVPNEVDAVLRGWEKAMGDLQSFGALVQRVTDDKVFKTYDEHKGFVLLKKGDKKDAPIQARIDLIKVANRDIFEKFICNGSDLFEYVPAQQTVRVHKIPKDKLLLQENTLVSFVLGMSAKQVTDRYHVKLDEKAQRDSYHYLVLYPKRETDKADFAVAQMALRRSDHLLALVRYRQKNGTEITWSFTSLQINPKLTAEQFQPDLPKGWQFDPVQAAVPETRGKAR